jgi:2-polyprenyl-6-methoxyphenol hydroxylase-like FAD-dependent oxidoreductase
MAVRALVAGAGPAGLAAALQLVTWCDEVHVVEARPRHRPRSVGEHLPPAGIRLVSSIGLGSLLDDPMHTRSSGVTSSWGAEEAAERHYYFTPSGSGINLRRPFFDAVLVTRAAELGVNFSFGTRLTGLRKADAVFEAGLRGPLHEGRYCADIVVDATGRQARAARMLGARVKRYDRLVGVVGKIDGAALSDDPGRLHIEAVENGWWYGLQFEDGELICVFMTDADLLRANCESVLGFWQADLRQSRFLRDRAGSGAPPRRVDVFNASSQQVCIPDLEGFIAVGDAAFAFDPLSSWGIAKGLRDGQHGGLALQARHHRDGAALKLFKQVRKHEFFQYLKQYSQFYRTEMRWSDAPFWQRRHMELT